MELSSTSALAAAAVATALLAAAHLAVPAIRRHERLPERVVASVASGVAVAYVFLHLLPELAEGNQRLGTALGETVEESALGELALFLVALGGFVVLYGLDHLATKRAQHGAETSVYWLHLGTFALYNGIVTYTLPLSFRTGVAYAVLFAVAMGIHFVLTDRHLDEHYGGRFQRSGRPVLAAALAGGWLAAWLAAPVELLVVSVLLALLGGFILFNVFANELPGRRQARYPAFLASAAAYSVLLVGVAALAS